MDRRNFTAGIFLIGLGCKPSESQTMVLVGDAGCATRARADLYQCEGCEGALERALSALRNRVPIGSGVDVGQPLRLEGTVFQPDGITPADDVLLYAYHTNAAGLYANGAGETEASRRHGRLRGWLRTDADGSYRFDTINPRLTRGGRCQPTSTSPCWSRDGDHTGSTMLSSRVNSASPEHIVRA